MTEASTALTHARWLTSYNILINVLHMQPTTMQRTKERTRISKTMVNVEDEAGEAIGTKKEETMVEPLEEEVVAAAEVVVVKEATTTTTM